MTIDINQQALVQNRSDSTAARGSQEPENAASMERSTGGGIDDGTFEDYDPAVEWSHAADDDTVTISLPGFKRKDIRVLVDNHGHLRTRGERPIVAGTRRSRFQKDFRLPDDCDIEGIRSKFENETLTVTLPKKRSHHPSPPDGSALEPAPTMPEEEEAADQGEGEEGEEGTVEKIEEAAGAAGEEGEEGTVGKIEEAGGRRRIRWLLATVAAVLFVGITGYVVWRKLRSGSAADAGDHGPGELAGPGSYVNEM